MRYVSLTCNYADSVAVNISVGGSPGAPLDVNISPHNFTNDQYDIGLSKIQEIQYGSNSAVRTVNVSASFSIVRIDTIITSNRQVFKFMWAHSARL